MDCCRTKWNESLYMRPADIEEASKIMNIPITVRKIGKARSNDVFVRLPIDS